MLRCWPIFSLFDDSWLESLITSASVKSWELGETVAIEGVRARRILLIDHGSVRISRRLSSGKECSFGTCGTGEIIGDYCLLSPGLNTANIRATQPTTTSALSIRQVLEKLGEGADSGRSLRAWLRFHFALRFVREQPFLGFMSAPSFLPLVECLEPVEFAAGMTIQAPGLAEDSCFVVRSGRVELEPGPYETAQRTSRIADECFGAETLLGGSPPLAIAVEPTRCWKLQRGLFHDPLAAAANHQSLHPSVRLGPRTWTWVRQLRANDCGVAALAMVLKSHLPGIEPSSVAAKVPLVDAGSSLAALANAAKLFGFRTTAVRVAARQLPTVALPALAHLADGHYVALFKVSADSVTVGDPALGIKQWTMAEFTSSWQGTLLLVAVESHGESQASNPAEFR